MLEISSKTNRKTESDFCSSGTAPPSIRPKSHFRGGAVAVELYCKYKFIIGSCLQVDLISPGFNLFSHTPSSSLTKLQLCSQTCEIGVFLGILSIFSYWDYFCIFRTGIILYFSNMYFFIFFSERFFSILLKKVFFCFALIGVL